MTTLRNRQSFAELFAISVAALVSHPFRTGLSALAVAAGISSTVAMMAVAEGARSEALRQLEEYGARTLIVRSRTGDDDPDLRGLARPLTVGDVRTLKTIVPSIADAIPVIYRFSTASSTAGERAAVVLGVEPEFHNIRTAPVSLGRSLGLADEGHSRVCLMGAALAADLFGDRIDLPQRVRVDGEWFTVIGILAQSRTRTLDDSQQYAADLDRTIVAPLGALPMTTPADPLQRVTQIWIAVEGSAPVESVRDVVDSTMLNLRRQVRDFEVVLPADLLRQRRSTQRIFNVITGSIAALALLVGGLGIANVLLASVVQRTPEIGLRRVVGATKVWIASQFVLESVLTTVIGGCGGVVGGMALSGAVARYSGWPVETSVRVAVAGLVCAMAVGLAAGVFPAIRAARLQPIDAVRFE